MSAYKQTFDEAIRLLGFNKALSELLHAAKIVAEKNSGQIVLHINNGGITKVCYNDWKV